MRTTKTVSRKISHNYRKILLLIKMDHGRRMGFAHPTFLERKESSDTYPKYIYAKISILICSRMKQHHLLKTAVTMIVQTRMRNLLNVMNILLKNYMKATKT